MKIQSIETFAHGTTVTVVRVKTDDGAVGYGQTAPFNADITATVLHRQVAPFERRSVTRPFCSWTQTVVTPRKGPSRWESCSRTTTSPSGAA